VFEESSSGSVGEIVTDVALVLDHVRVANCPAVMVAGDAEIVAVTCDGLGGGGAGVGGGVPGAAEPELHPLMKAAIRRNPQQKRIRRNR
jgi:hypothetical protein